MVSVQSMGSHIVHNYQAKLEQRSGTWVVCTVWDPISFRVVATIVNDMGSHTVHTMYLNVVIIWTDDGYL